jgi:hypothetical protein
MNGREAGMGEPLMPKEQLLLGEREVLILLVQNVAGPNLSVSFVDTEAIRPKIRLPIHKHW